MGARFKRHRYWLVATNLIVAMAAGGTLAQSPRSIHFKFAFGAGAVAPEYTHVLPAMTYAQEVGFGFEPIGSAPTFFSVAVPEGHYRVTITFGDAQTASDNTVYAELRRLMVESLKTEPGKFVTRTFLVDVRRPDLVSGGAVVLKDREKTTEAWAWDDRLTMEFNGVRPAVARMEIEGIERGGVPTVYLLGDSTMCDQPREPYNSWGQMLTRFLKATVVVANHAESGESIGPSLSAHRFDKVWSGMTRGDYLFVQFGHNDMKSTAPNALQTYMRDMTHVVEETRRLGGIPVIVTSVSRRTFDADGRKITDSFKGYTQAARDVAVEQHVPLIDLQAATATFYEALGPEKSHLAFATMEEGTHHNDYGSYEIAKSVLMGIKAARLDLAKYIVDDFKGFDPARPDPIETFRLPKSSLVTNVPLTR